MISGPDLFLVLRLLKNELWTNRRVHAVTRKFPRAYFCLKVRPTDQVPFLQSTATLLFPVCALSLHSAFSPTLIVRATLLCLSTTLALPTTVTSSSYRLTHRGFLVCQVLICWTMSLNDSRLLCDLSNLRPLVGEENYPLFPVITDPVQCHHTVLPHLRRSNGPRL